jgi:hypothetical protein
MSAAVDETDCAVAFDEGNGCVTMTWRGYRSSAAFRAANERVLAALAEHGARRLLGDIEALGAIAPADEAWLVEDWIPRAVAAGLDRAALVTPAFDVRHAPVLLVGERLSSPMLRYFDELDAARAWLGEAAP